MGRDEDWWLDAYRKKGALWIHDGNPRRPHAILTGNAHSGGVFNSRRIISDDTLMRFAAKDLVDWYVALNDSINHVTCVVGPQTGATKLARYIAAEISKFCGRPCRFASPEKQGDGDSRRMVFTDPDNRVRLRDRVLLCEDVLSTGGSVDLTAKACDEAGATVFPIVLAMVNRTGCEQVGGRNILALINRPMPKWEPADCPLCPQGSKALQPPKSPDNWAALNADY